MTLRDVLQALRRRWWLVIGPAVVVVVVSLVGGSPEPKVVQARLSFALDVPPSLVIPTSDAHAAKVGEALVDDISRVISGDKFAERIQDRLEPTRVVNPGEIASSLSATDRHRVVDVTVTRTLPPGAAEDAVGANRDDLEEIAGAVVDELQENGGDWFALLGAGGARLNVVDGPSVVILGATWRRRLELPLRLAAALALGAALALAAWLVDPRIRTPEQAATVAGAPVVGAVAGGGGGRT